jgi:hypothetical protein
MFGEDVISALRAALPAEKILGSWRGAFVLGCQGPDIFYHSQRSRPVALEYGSLLHRRGFGVYAANLLKTTLSGAGTDANSAYSLGFMTHAALDRACHPYIIYRGGNYHSFFERILDALMLKKLRGLEPASWDQEIALASVCENPPPGLKEIIAASLGETFPERAGKDRSLARRIDNAFIDCARFYNMSSPSKIAGAFRAGSNEKLPVFTRRALNYVYPENLPAEIDFLNLNRRAWRYPHISAGGKIPQDDNRSFTEIYSDAVNSAAASFAPCFVTLSDGTFPFDEIVEKIGNGGLSIQDENGKRCSPNLTDPLPLEEVMKQQAKFRGVE